VRLFKRILALNAAVGLVSCLLMLGLHPWTRSQVLVQVVSSFSGAFFVGTPVMLMLTRYGKAMYRLRSPLNWIALCCSILGCTAAGVFVLCALSVALGVLTPSKFSDVFLFRMQSASLLALSIGLGAVTYHTLREDLEAATLELKNKQLEQERAGKLAAEAQLASLESHVRPHFLFNTLNTISSLIPEDPKRAESLVGKLATLLRLSLDSSQERLSSLERELKLVNDYLEIEKARFGDRLRCTVDVPIDLYSATIPTLTLQTLVENSVKHAVASRFEGANVRVEAHTVSNGIVLSVSDDGPGFTASSIRSGHGLDNVQRRLNALFGPSGTMEIFRSGNITTVALSLPSNGRKTA
jgi:sensor histidine kinase YesM